MDLGVLGSVISAIILPGNYLLLKFGFYCNFLLLSVLLLDFFGPLLFLVVCEAHLYYWFTSYFIAALFFFSYICLNLKEKLRSALFFPFF